MKRRTFLERSAGALVVAATHPLYLGRNPIGRTTLGGSAGSRSADETRLYANENPYGPPPAAREAMADVLRYAHRYGRFGTDG
ncbi:MAG: hypothetical protein ACODAA_07720, partial [Gemmatimonadota bacterium]